MLIEESPRGLRLLVSPDEEATLRDWGKIRDDSIDSDSAMLDFISPEALDPDGLEWIRPEDVGALTSAPMLGRRDGSGRIVDAFGFMDYQVRSVLGDLAETGEAFFERG